MVWEKTIGWRHGPFGHDLVAIVAVKGLLPCQFLGKLECANHRKMEALKQTVFSNWIISKDRGGAASVKTEELAGFRIHNHATKKAVNYHPSSKSCCSRLFDGTLRHCQVARKWMYQDWVTTLPVECIEMNKKWSNIIDPLNLLILAPTSVTNGSIHVGIPQCLYKKRPSCSKPLKSSLACWIPICVGHFTYWFVAKIAQAAGRGPCSAAHHKHRRLRLSWSFRIIQMCDLHKWGYP